MINLFNGKKGITPIIAIILLLMMTVAVAGAAFFWLSRIQNQLQGGVESFQGTMMTQISSRLDVIDADYDRTDHNLTIFFQNTGNTKIPVKDEGDPPITTWIFKNSDQVPVCSGNWNSTSDAECQDGCGEDVQIGVGDYHKVVLDLDTSGDCAIDTSEYGKIFSFTIDFSGTTTSSGSFIA